MPTDKNNNSRNLVKLLYPINIYRTLQRFYFLLFPKGSKAYQFTHSILYIFLKRIHIFNIYYREWIRRFDTFTMDEIQDFHDNVKLMPEKPTISIVMPVYNPPPDLLDQAIQSVIKQIYPFWELCIADDASTDPRIPALIHEYVMNDTRIKAIFREENGHISAASNSAFELVSNDFMALLDHDDILHPMALYFVAKEIIKYPDSVIIYSDEDKITKQGKRLDPYFKPDFNYELLLSQNMVSHLGVFRTEKVREVKGFRIGLEGSQDYDLVLRILDTCTPDQIHHIPRPLYHWRMIKESAARNLNVKSYAINSATQALEDHFTRRNINANVEFLPALAGYYVSYILPDIPPNVSIIIPGYNFSELIMRQVDELLRNTQYPNFQVVIGLSHKDNVVVNSLIKDWQGKVLIHHQTNGKYISYSQKINQCVSATTSDFICLMDENITGFKPGWLRTLIGQAAQPGVGVVSPKLINTLNNRVWSNGIVFLPGMKLVHLSHGEEREPNGYFGWAKLTRGYSALSERCFLVKRKYFIKVSGFTEALHTPMYCGVDFCLKLRGLGYRNILRPLVELSINNIKNNYQVLEVRNELIISDKTYFDKTWHKWLSNDPGFNPNLDIIDEKFLINLNLNRTASRKKT